MLGALLATFGLGHAGAAVAAGAPVLSQLPGGGGCVVWQGERRGCANAVGMTRSDGMALSPDGRQLYVATMNPVLPEVGEPPEGSPFGGVVVIQRDSISGAVSQELSVAPCLSESGTGGCVRAQALHAPDGVVVSPDGANIYVISGSAGNGSTALAFRGTLAAFARDPSTGALTQLGGSDACLGAGDCTPTPGIGGPKALAISGDGRFLYVAGTHGTGDHVRIGILARDPGTGALHEVGQSQLRPQGGVGVGGIALSPDGRQLYVVTTHGVAALQRNPDDGRLSQLAGRRGCVAQGGGSGCTAAHRMTDPQGIAVSRDGRNVYVGSGRPGGLVVLRRKGGTGALSQPAGARGCVGATRQSPGGCAVSRGLHFGPSAIAVTPDGGRVYATSESAGATAILGFARGAGGALRQLPGAAGCVTNEAVRRRACASTVRALSEPTQIAFSADSAFAYVDATGVLAFRARG